MLRLFRLDTLPEHITAVDSGHLGNNPRQCIPLAALVDRRQLIKIYASVLTHCRSAVLLRVKKVFDTGIHPRNGFLSFCEDNVRTIHPSGLKMLLYLLCLYSVNNIPKSEITQKVIIVQSCTGLCRRNEPHCNQHSVR